MTVSVLVSALIDIILSILGQKRAFLGLSTPPNDWNKFVLAKMWCPHNPIVSVRTQVDREIDVKRGVRSKIPGQIIFEDGWSEGRTVDTEQ